MTTKHEEGSRSAYAAGGKMPERLEADPPDDGTVGTVVTADGEVFAQAHSMISDGALPSSERVRVRRERAREIARRWNAHEGLEFALRRIVEDLPTRRDWLDPEVEKLARDILATLKD